MTVPLLDTDGSRRHRRYFVIILLAVLLLVFLHMLASVVAGVIAGVLLWVMTRPVYDFILKHTGKRSSLAAGLSVLATVLVVVIPLAAIVLIMTADALRLAADIQGWIPSIQSRLNEWIDTINSRGLSVFGYQLSPEWVNAKIGEFTATAGQFLLQLTQRTASSIAKAIFTLFVALYTLYYFYVDGDHFLGWFKETIPLEPEHSTHLIDNFFNVSIATLKTIGIIGAAQGILAGIAFVVIGIPAPFFLTILTVFATAIPTIGTGLVVIPVVVGLFIAGQTGWAIALLIWFLVVVSSIDNFLRPHLLHRSVPLHQLVLFIVTLGGIARFGFFGVFVGPMIAALLNASIDIYREVYPRPAGAAPRVPDSISPQVKREQ